MGHIILSGEGDGKQTKKLDEFFVSLLPKAKNVLYIPIAMPQELHTYKECLVWFRSTMKALGVHDITMATNLEDMEYHQLKDYAAVYIGGGNTFYLWKKVKEAQFDKKLDRYIKDGGVVYGGSAGAIIIGKDIGTAKFGGDADKNKVRLRNFRSMDLARELSIQCHYTKAYEKQILEYVKKNGMDVVSLPKETGLHIHKNKIRVIGTKPAYLFGATSKKKIAVNASF